VKPARFVALAAAASLFLAARAPRAADADAAAPPPSPDANAARRATVVAHVGPRAITAGELEDRLALVPRYQLVTFGSTPADVSRKFLNDVIVPEVLLALGAEDQHLDQDVVVANAITRTLSGATLRAVRAQLGLARDIPMSEVQAYYDANRARFDSPERINVWRILCSTREDAQAVLDAAKKDGSVPTWNQLARDRSVDKATYMRGGNLGFVGPDGTSSEPGLMADAAVVKAAQGVKDGEIVGAPVPEGRYFSVVWRRGTVKASHKGLDEVAPQIRDALWAQKKAQAEQDLMNRLRAEKVSALDESLLGTFDLSGGAGVPTPRRRPGQVEPLPRAGKGEKR
jgi:peptidyl-prolyl cis-trans isomerase C